MSFCENLFRYNKQIELHWKTDEEWGNRIQFTRNILDNEAIEAIAKSMVDVFLIHRLSNFIKKIIEKDFYYTNKDEIERILDLSHWIFKGEDDESRKIRVDQSPSKILMSLFIANLKNKSTVHFDSIVKFRLNVFKAQLQSYVGLAIDEFKQEEDHQAFIDMLRKYIAKQESVYHEVHILQGKTFSFYKDNGKKFSTLELRKLMHNKPLYIVGLDAKEFNLAPLVAMAPKKIKIYGDNPSEPKTLTVINVFQEKVELEPYNHFPFPHCL